MQNIDYASTIEMRVSLADGSFVPVVDSITFEVAVAETFLGNGTSQAAGGIEGLFDKNESSAALKHAAGAEGVLFYFKLKQRAAAIGGRILSGYDSHELPALGLSLYGSNDAMNWTKTADLVSIPVARNYGCGTWSVPVLNCKHEVFGNFYRETHVYRFVVVNLLDSFADDVTILDIAAIIANGLEYVYPASELSFLHPLLSNADDVGVFEKIFLNGTNIFSIQTEKPVHKFIISFQVKNAARFGVDVYRDDVLVSPASSAEKPTAYIYEHTVSHFLAVIGTGPSPALSEFRAGYGDTRRISGPVDAREISEIVAVHSSSELFPNATLNLLFDGVLVLDATRSMRFHEAAVQTVLLYFEVPKNTMPQTGEVWASGMTSAALYFAHTLPVNVKAVAEWTKLINLTQYLGHARLNGEDPQYTIEGTYEEQGVVVINLHGDLVPGVVLEPSQDSSALGLLGSHIVTYGGGISNYSMATRRVLTGPVGPVALPLPDVNQHQDDSSSLTVDMNSIFEVGNTDLVFQVQVNNHALVNFTILGTILTLTKFSNLTGATDITISAYPVEPYAQPQRADANFTYIIYSNTPPRKTQLALQDIIGAQTIDLSKYFTDADLDILSYEVTVSDATVVTAEIVGTNLHILRATQTLSQTETATVSVVARDRSDFATDDFMVTFMYVAPTIRIISEQTQTDTVVDLLGAMTSTLGESKTRWQITQDQTQEFNVYPQTIPSFYWRNSRDWSGYRAGDCRRFPWAYNCNPYGNFHAYLDVSSDEGATWTTIYSHGATYSQDGLQWTTPSRSITLTAGHYYKFRTASRNSNSAYRN